MELDIDVMPVLSALTLYHSGVTMRRSVSQWAMHLSILWLSSLQIVKMGGSTALPLMVIYHFLSQKLFFKVLISHSIYSVEKIFCDSFYNDLVLA